MTPKEKAKELIDKFTFDSVSYLYTKQSALILIDEIISSMHWQYILNGLDYWQEVKQEIELI